MRSVDENILQLDVLSPLDKACKALGLDKIKTQEITLHLSKQVVAQRSAIVAFKETDMPAPTYLARAISGGKSVVSMSTNALTLEQAIEDTSSAAKSMMTPTWSMIPTIRTPYTRWSLAGDVLGKWVLPSKNEAAPKNSSAGTCKTIAEYAQSEISNTALKVVLSSAPIRLGESAKRVFIEPSFRPLKKEAFQKGVHLAREATQGVLAELNGMNDIILEINKLIGEGVEQTLSGPVAEVLERVGQTRAAVEGASGAVSSFFAQKKLNDWIAHLTKAGGRVQGETLLDILNNASGAYKLSMLWNMVTLIQEAPPVFDSIVQLVNFMKNPKAEGSAYLNLEIEKIKALIPKSKPWPIDDFPTRFALYNALTSGQSSLTEFIKNIAWDAFYDKALSAADNNISKVGAILGSVLAGTKFRALYSVDEMVAAAKLSGFIGIEKQLGQCLIDTTGYYTLSTLFEKAGAYVASHVIKGIVRKLLLEQKKAFLKKTEETIRLVLRERILFNPDELNMLDYCQQSQGYAVDHAKEIEFIQQLTILESVLLLQAATSNEQLASSHIDVVQRLKQQVIVGNNSLIQQSLRLLPLIISTCQLAFAISSVKKKDFFLDYPGKAIEALAQFSVPITAITTMAVVGYALKSTMISMATTTASNVTMITEASQEHPYILATTTASMYAYAYSTSFREGVNSYIAKPLGKGINYVLHSPSLLTSVGVGLSYLAEDPGMAVAFAIPTAINLVRTGGEGALQAVTNTFSFIRNQFWSSRALDVKQPSVPVEPIAVPLKEFEPVGDTSQFQPHKNPLEACLLRATLDDLNKKPGVLLMCEHINSVLNSGGAFCIEITHNAIRFARTQQEAIMDSSTAANPSFFAAAAAADDESVILQFYNDVLMHLKDHLKHLQGEYESDSDSSYQL